MSNLIVFDTSIIVQDLREGRHAQRIDSVRGIIRMSSVVLAELWRGATRREEREFLRWLEGRSPVLTPTEKNWLESGHVLGRIATTGGSQATSCANCISMF